MSSQGSGVPREHDMEISVWVRRTVDYRLIKRKLEILKQYNSYNIFTLLCNIL